jgi:hypothetical protein
MNHRSTRRPDNDRELADWQNGPEPDATPARILDGRELAAHLEHLLSGFNRLRAQQLADSQATYDAAHPQRAKGGR